MKNLFYTALIGFTIISCKAQNADPDSIILTVAGEEITKSEFERVFYKNNPEDESEEALEEYLQLYINFKLKVKAAEELMMDTSQAFKKELAGYRRQLASTYLTDKELESKYLKEAYEMYKTEINTSHIFLKLGKRSTPADTLEMFNKINAIYDEYKAGKSFDELVVENTDNEEIKRTKGNIGFRSASDLFYRFSSTVFYAGDGEVVPPIRTKYGYHIIRMEGRRESRGEIEVAHILTKSEKAGSDIAAEELIKNLHEQIVAGADFASLAGEHSHDKRSSANGGKLKKFGAGKMFTEFEEAAFALENDGDVSVPVRTKLGWHIIKRLGRTGIESYENVVHKLKKKISSDERARIISRSFLKLLLKEYKFSDDLKMRNQFYGVLDESFIKRKWDIAKADGMNKVMFSLRGRNYAQNDFAEYIAGHQRRMKVFNVKLAVNNLYKSFVNESCMNLANKLLGEKYPEFKALIKEYRDGILLFELTDSKVWTKAVEDTIGLEKFYNANKSNFMKEESARAIIVSCTNSSDAKSTRKLVKKKSMEDALLALNAFGKGVKARKGSYTKEEELAITNSSWKKGIGADVDSAGVVQYAIIYAIQPERQRSIDEARGLITAEYQDYLEDQWVALLKEKYEVIVDTDVLLSIGK